MQKRIIYIIHTLKMGGTQKQLVNLMRGLLKKGGYYIEVVVLYKSGPITHEIEQLGVKINYIKMKNIYDLFGLIRLTQLLRLGNFDIAHTSLLEANLLGTISAKLAGIRTIISSRRDTDVWKKKKHIWAECLGVRLSNIVITNSYAVKEFIILQEKTPAAKIEVIPNGTDLSFFSKRIEQSNLLREEFGFSKDDYIIGTIGTLHEKKGQRYLVEAAAKILEAFPRCKFVFVGEGPLRPELERVSESLKLKDKIIFTGLRQDIPAILSMIDLFCLPSTYESSPNVILEAMACALPVVATDVGGVSEAVINGETGILVQPRDSGALAEAILGLLADKSLQGRMGQRGKEIIEKKFSLERMVKEYDDLYVSLTKKYMS